MIVSLGGKVVLEYTIQKERVKIGRHPHNDVVIDNRAISGEHAILLWGPKDVVLEDLNSTNGSMVNGQPVKRHFVQEGDVIELAKYRVELVRDPAPAAPPPVAKTQPAMIKVLNGANAGKVLILSKPLTTLGRPGNVAAITRSNGQYLLAHIEGEQYLLLNGNLVGSIPENLRNGDMIQFAGTEMAFIST